MKRYYSPDESEAKASEKGTTEDPPNNVTKQNSTGDDKEKKEEINVPKEALENYKESGKETEE